MRLFVGGPMIWVFCVICVIVSCSSDRAVPTPEHEDKIIEDHYRQILSGQIAEGLFHPYQLVVGDQNYQQLPRTENAIVRPEAIEAVVNRLEPIGSSQLMIMHRGNVIEDIAIGLEVDARYNSFSMHKSLVSLLVGKAIALGYIQSVSEPIGHYLPEWQGDPRGEITILDVLEMAGGLDHERPSPDPPYNLETRMVFGNDLWGSTFKRRQVSGPGTLFHYKNAESQILAIILERATEQTYAELLSEWLWQPIGAHDAKVWLDAPGGKARVFCCLLSAAEDWLRVGNLILNSGRLNGEQLIDELWLDELTAPSRNNPSYGYQIWLGSSPEDMNGVGFPGPIGWKDRLIDEDTIMLAGFGGQRTYIMPACDLVVVRIGSPNMGDWNDSFIPNTILSGINRAVCEL